MSRSENQTKGKEGGKNGPKKDRDRSNDSSDEDNAERIRVGKDYQSICPLVKTATRTELDSLDEKAVLVWQPTGELPEERLDNYVKVAKDKHGYNAEQALGMLYWHKYDIERALVDLGNFTPYMDDWSAEDQVLFEQAFQFHGKSFNRIRQMLPDKSVASLVKYYYSWKKTRQKTSVMDFQEKNLMKNGSSDKDSEKESNETSDTEEKTASTQPPPEEKPTSSLLLECAGCGVACSEVNGTVHGKLCNSCYQHFRRTGSLRPTSGPSCLNKRYRPSGSEKHKRHPPRGIYINHDDIVSLATASQSDTKQPDLLVGMEREIASHRSAIQTNLQRTTALQESNQLKLEDLTPPESNNKVSMRWTNEENMLVVQGVRQHGKDIPTIASILGTKTEAQIKAFFVNYRRKYSLDRLVREHEAEVGTKKTGNDAELLEIDLDEENTNINAVTEEAQGVEKRKAETNSALNP